MNKEEVDIVSEKIKVNIKLLKEMGFERISLNDYYTSTMKIVEDLLDNHQWYSAMIKPEEDKEIIVRDDIGKEYDSHYWNGHRFYEYVGEDGYPSDRDIVSWRYKDNK